MSKTHEISCFELQIRLNWVTTSESVQFCSIKKKPIWVPCSWEYLSNSQSCTHRFSGLSTEHEGCDLTTSAISYILKIYFSSVPLNICFMLSEVAIIKLKYVNELVLVFLWLLEANTYFKWLQVPLENKNKVPGQWNSQVPFSKGSLSIV